ncbi:1960_t:CDS:2, partial [Racocetra persica]
TMLLGINWFQKVQVQIHFNEQKLLFRYLEKSNEIPIIQTHEDKLEIPQKAYSSDEDDFFTTYESEDDLDEVESYHTDDASTDNEEFELVKVKTLNEKQQTEALCILKKFGGLFSSELENEFSTPNFSQKAADMGNINGIHKKDKTLEPLPNLEGQADSYTKE